MLRTRPRSTGGRIGTTTKTNGGKANKENNRIAANGGYVNDVSSQEHNYGRFPANIIFDEEAGKILDEQSGISKSTGGRSGNKEGVGQNGIYGQYKGEVRDENPGLGDTGGASRFFYCPKTSKRDITKPLKIITVFVLGIVLGISSINAQQNRERNQLRLQNLTQEQQQLFQDQQLDV